MRNDQRDTKLHEKEEIIYVKLEQYERAPLVEANKSHFFYIFVQRGYLSHIIYIEVFELKTIKGVAFEKNSKSLNGHLESRIRINLEINYFQQKLGSRKIPNIRESWPMGKLISIMGQIIYHT